MEQVIQVTGLCVVGALLALVVKRLMVSPWVRVSK